MFAEKLYSPSVIDEIIQEKNGEVLEIIPGNLLDDMLFEIDGNIYAALEVATTTWTSAYRIIANNDVFEVWQKRYEEYIDFLEEIGDYETLEMEI